MRTRLRRLHNIVVEAAEKFRPAFDDIYPEIQVDPIYTKLSEVFLDQESPVPELFPALVQEPGETAEERLVNDMALYWTGGDFKATGARGGSSVAPFPSVAITEMIQNLGPQQKRALAIHMGLDQLLAEQGKKATDSVTGYGTRPITKVTIGSKSYGHTVGVIMDTKVKPNRPSSEYIENDQTERAVVIRPRVYAGRAVKAERA